MNEILKVREFIQDRKIEIISVLALTSTVVLVDQFAKGSIGISYPDLTGFHAQIYRPNDSGTRQAVRFEFLDFSQSEIETTQPTGEVPIVGSARLGHSFRWEFSLSGISYEETAQLIR